MRSGQYIRALGRQSFEPSSHHHHHHHHHHHVAGADSDSISSQERQRQLIKAQNDVLATVGVCLRDTKSSLEKSESLMAENEAGLVVGALDLTTTYLTSWPLVGLRNRLQTYKRFSGLRYRDVVRMAWNETAPRARLFAGMPAHLCYQLSNLTRDYVQARFFAWISRKPYFMDPKTKKPRNRRLLRVAGKVVSFASWFAIYPLYYHSNVQTLDLAAASPLMPSWRSFIPFTQASPISGPVITGSLFSLATVQSILLQTAGSFFFQSFVMQSISISLQYFFFKKLLKILPTPTYEHQPLSPAAADAYTQYDDGMDYIDSVSVAGETAADDIDTVAGIAAESHTTAIEIAEVDANDNRVYRATVHLDPETGDPAPNPSPEPIQDDLYVDSEAGDVAAALPQQEQENGLPGAAAAAAAAAAEPPNTRPASPIPRRRRHQHYRTTTLSSHPVDVVASHMADCIAGSVMLAAETMVMRCLARSVLGVRGLGVEAVDALVYGPFDATGGTGLIAKAMVVGEWGLMWALFEITWVVSTVVGVRWFGYGYKK